MNKGIIFGWDSSIDKEYKKIERKEGEIFVENDVEWIIKNGIKQNVTKLTEARIPLFCPRCGKVMNSNVDEISYRYYNQCHVCCAKDEMKYALSDDKTPYEIKKLNDKINDLDDFLKDIEEEKKEFLKSLKVKTYVNEFGDVEDWGENEIDENLMVEKYKKLIDEINITKKEITEKLKKLDHELSQRNNNKSTETEPTILG